MNTLLKIDMRFRGLKGGFEGQQARHVIPLLFPSSYQAKVFFFFFFSLPLPRPFCKHGAKQVQPCNGDGEEGTRQVI
jgi:hypothetical protein